MIAGLRELAEQMYPGPWEYNAAEDSVIGKSGRGWYDVIAELCQPAVGTAIALVPELVAVAEAAERIAAEDDPESWDATYEELAAALAALRARLEDKP